MLALTGALLLAAAPPPPPPPQQGVIARFMVRERIILRVPAARMAPVSQRQSRWREKKGPKCVGMDEVGGAAVSGDSSVDLILRGGARVRAEFEDSCPALDFYSGFYILPTADRKICADRDAVRARSGGECEITRFRALTPDDEPADKAHRSPLDRVRRVFGGH